MFAPMTTWVVQWARPDAPTSPLGTWVDLARHTSEADAVAAYHAAEYEMDHGPYGPSDGFTVHRVIMRTDVVTFP